VIYRALGDVIDGRVTRDGLFGLAALALVFVVAQHAFMATSTWVSHRADRRTRPASRGWPAS
jgi:hypothetical protein